VADDAGGPVDPDVCPAESVRPVVAGEVAVESGIEQRPEVL